jgi:hypothetical protein
MAIMTPASDLCRGVCDRVRDGVVTFLPVPVVEHLADTHRHLASAVVRVAELQKAKADQWVERARELQPQRPAPTSDAAAG